LVLNPVYGRKLSKEQLADLKATILSNPKSMWHRKK
jgi:hypothetical protein